MPYAIYRVVRFERATRKTVKVFAEGLTMQQASTLASSMRLLNASFDTAERFGYAVETLPLSRQIELAEAAGLMLAAVDPAPYRLAA